MELAARIALDGHRSACERLRDLPGEHLGDLERWHAVRTGCDSNDLNGVWSGRGFVPSDDLLSELVSWFGTAPATWLAERPDPSLTEVLCRHGLRPERSGSWCGRSVSAPARLPDGPVRVRSGQDADDWMRVARTCGWVVDDAEEERRRLLWQDLTAGAAADEWRPRWVVRDGGEPVAMASAWGGQSVELVDLAVVPAARRRGIGTDLVTAVLGWACALRARRIVAAPSPDGWGLLETLGFVSVPVVPDVAFYFPPPTGRGRGGPARPA